LDTWIYKGTAARIDHQDGCHDDTLTCLAMAVFVMNYSMKKFLQAKEKDKIILKAWTNTTTLTNNNNYDITVKKSTEIYATPKKYTMPIYNGNNNNGNKTFPYMWLLK
jgi:hypothetical protein